MYGTNGTADFDAVRLGRVLRDQRGALNMTQPDVAERAQVSVAYVYMLEVGGLPRPGLDTLLRVADVLGMARLKGLLEDVQALGATGPLSPSVADVATAEALRRFLRELHR